MDTSERQIRFWNRIAAKYANDPIEDEAGYERTLEVTRTWLGPETRAFEFGCGTGSTAIRLAPHLRSIHATDTSPAMIDIANRKAEAAGVHNITFAVGSADAAGGADAHDAVLAFNVIHLIPDWRAVLARLGERMAPGALFISKTACIAELNPMIRLAIPLMGLLGKAPPVAVFPERELLDGIKAAGFEILANERHGTRGKDVRAVVIARKKA
ncbi:class I SAM-dependent methyltransferase [Pelagibacterium montanilacus]|uniref:class I SAM-dependent methyltransferase n=1 Tax=Pelagibacterium montanilacus TaxID=2185280 RepID=UPI000F8DAA54|nr:class I SAM-dependent methyltransferase [Pelagibacterium montanilacus]